MKVRNIARPHKEFKAFNKFISIKIKNKQLYKAYGPYFNPLVKC